MKVYAYEAPAEGLFLRTAEYKGRPDNYKFIGIVDLCFEMPKKLIQKRREFKNCYELSDCQVPLTSKNIVLTYDVEE